MQTISRHEAGGGASRGNGEEEEDPLDPSSPRIHASAAEKAQLDEWPSDKHAYEFKVKIGEGNFAVVHVAVLKNSPSHVCAVKKLNFDMLDISIESIRKEITTMSRCVHPNVLSLFKSFTDEEYLYIVLPYMDCGSFRDVIMQREEQVQKSGGADLTLLREEWIAITIAEVCTGLEYIHRMGWMHRDLKAANILLNRKGEVKIADFGVAGMKDTPDPVLRKREVQRRTFVGTPCWMAPEVMRQEEGYSDRADIWSLGICVLELAKGYPPYAKERAMKVLLRTIRDPSPNFDTYKEFEPDGAPRRRFGTNIKNFVRATLMKDPRQRPSATRCLRHPFLAHYAGKSESNRKRLREELCVKLQTVDVRREVQVQDQVVLMRAESGQILPADHPDAADATTVKLSGATGDNGDDQRNGGSAGNTHTAANDADAAGQSATGTAGDTTTKPGDSAGNHSNGVVGDGAQGSASTGGRDGQVALPADVVSTDSGSSIPSTPGSRSQTTASTPGDVPVSVNELSRQLDMMNQPEGVNVSTPSSPAGVFPIDTTNVTPGSVTSDESTVFTPTVGGGSRRTKDAASFTAQLITRRVSHLAHNGSTSLEVVSGIPELVDPDVPRRQHDRQVGFDNQVDERADIIRTLADFLLVEHQQRLAQQEEEEESRRRQQAAEDVNDRDRQGGDGNDGGNNGGASHGGGDSNNNPGGPGPAGDSSGGSASSPQNADGELPPSHGGGVQGAAETVLTAEQQSALLEKIEREVEAKKQEKEAEHANLQDDGNFEDLLAKAFTE